MCDEVRDRVTRRDDVEEDRESIHVGDQLEGNLDATIEGDDDQPADVIYLIFCNLFILSYV